MRYLLLTEEKNIAHSDHNSGSPTTRDAQLQTALSIWDQTVRALRNEPYASAHGLIGPAPLKGPYDSSGFPVGCKSSCLANLDGNQGN
jgi:hypothetical protein